MTKPYKICASLNVVRFSDSNMDLSRHSIKIASLKRGRVINAGADGTVFESQLQLSTLDLKVRPVAVKELYGNFNKDRVQLLFQIKHENIVEIL